MARVRVTGDEVMGDEVTGIDRTGDEVIGDEMTGAEEERSRRGFMRRVSEDRDHAARPEERRSDPGPAATPVGRHESR